MVEPGVDERPSGAVWPPVTVEHHYAVSEALPLHRLGLVPPPPEIGPHLLTASPIEAALAAAEATAELQAIPTPLPEPVPEPELDPAGNPEFAVCETAAVDLESGTGASGVADWTEAVHLADPDAGISITSDDPLYIMPPDAPVTAPGSAEVANGEIITTSPAGETGEAPGSLSWTLRTAADGDEPLRLADESTVHGPTAVDVSPSGPAHAKLMRLDLSRRGDAPPAKEMPLPPLPDAPLTAAVATTLPGSPAVRPAVPSPAQAPAAARPRMSQYEPPAGNWPGFLTGIVMAVAIGVGLYVSLVGS